VAGLGRTFGRGAMTNHWVDIGNASCVFVIGANPTENHPASMAHVNRARYDLWNRGRRARMVVVDPRKTRTAVQADLYVRIRPGTDIAFVNGLLNYVFKGVELGTVNATFASNFVNWHNGTAANSTSVGRAFYADDNGLTANAVTFNAAALYTAGVNAKVLYDGVPTNAFDSPTYGTRGWPKWCDTRVKVNSTDPSAVDYKRVVMTTTTGKVFTNMVELAESIGDPDCVYQRLKAHCAAYTDTVVADICGCSTADIAAVAIELMNNSQMMSDDFSSNGFHEPNSAGYRATTLMYAMGATQHTYGSQNVRSYAVLQTMLGNMGRPGGGINALRGIHNVQGSTDMGVLYDGIPGYYTGNPGHSSLTESYASYQNRQFGQRTDGSANSVDPYAPATLGLQQQGFYNMTSAFFCDYRSLVSPYAAGDFDKLFDLWPKGNGKDHITAFRLMQGGTPEIKACVVWGQNPAVTEPNQSAVRTAFENLDLLVVVDNFATETAEVQRKTNGVTYLLPASSYIEEAGSVSNSGRWIQWRMRARKPWGNSKADIDLLLRLAKEIDRAGGFTHIKNQWATMAAAPASATDAYKVLFGDQYGFDPGALNVPGDIEAVTRTSADGVAAVGAAGNFGFVAATGTVYGTEAVCESIFEQICSPLGAYSGSNNNGKGTLWIYARAFHPTKTSERPLYINNNLVDWLTVNRAKCRDLSANAVGSWHNYPRFGFAWLLNRRVMYNNVTNATAVTIADVTPAGLLVTARTLKVPDEADNFVGPGYLARMMSFTARNTNTLANWTGHFSYRSYNTLRDMPSVVVGTGTNPVVTTAGTPHAGCLPGNIPAHCEPIETPRRDLAATWGRNLQWKPSIASVYGTTVKTDTNVAMWSSAESYTDAFYGSGGSWTADAKDYPLVLTSIRCVEHFQGGPITRNNSWNVEAEPVPWIEINSVDARACVPPINDGDWVDVITARSNSTTDQEGRTRDKGWAKGFKARVGVGLQGNQRVAAGTVAIPWHWGDQGLGTGSRANDLCIDAFDSNTVIPEYKACLCKIVKL
jgi:anaerobic selenocysteine-containing dehydrogenase